MHVNKILLCFIFFTTHNEAHVLQSFHLVVESQKKTKSSNDSTDIYFKSFMVGYIFAEWKKNIKSENLKTLILKL